MSIFISFVIPVYQRQSQLEILIESIVFSVSCSGKSTDLFEICISDNSPDIRNLNRLNALVDKTGIKLSYFRNRTNIGANLNLVKAMSLGSGKYVQVLGSDDVLSSDYISTVVSYLSKNSPFYLFVPHSSIKSNSIAYLLIKHFSSLATSYYMLLLILGTENNFISSNIFLSQPMKKLVQSYRQDLDKSNNFFYYKVILEYLELSLACSDHLRIINRFDLILNGYDKNVTYDWLKTFLFDMQAVLMSSKYNKLPLKYKLLRWYQLERHLLRYRPFFSAKFFLKAFPSYTFSPCFYLLSIKNLAYILYIRTTKYLCYYS